MIYRRTTEQHFRLTLKKCFSVYAYYFYVTFLTDHLRLFRLVLENQIYFFSISIFQVLNRLTEFHNSRLLDKK